MKFENKIKIFIIFLIGVNLLYLKIARDIRNNIKKQYDSFLINKTNQIIDNSTTHINSKLAADLSNQIELLELRENGNKEISSIKSN
jgi:hypothetical protein